jgi:hypothetical protein
MTGMLGQFEIDAIDLTWARLGPISKGFVNVDVVCVVVGEIVEVVSLDVTVTPILSVAVDMGEAIVAASTEANVDIEATSNIVLTGVDMEFIFGIEIGETVDVVFSEIGDQSNVGASARRRVCAPPCAEESRLKLMERFLQSTIGL